MDDLEIAAKAVHESSRLRWLWIDAIRTAEDLAPISRLVCFALSFHMRADGANCHVSERTLSRESGLSERAVRTHLRAVEGWDEHRKKIVPSRQWLQVFRYTREGWSRDSSGGRFANEYSPLIPSHFIADMLERYRAGEKVPEPWREIFKAVGP